MSIFDVASPRGSHGCPVCGAKPTMQVMVQARQLSATGGYDKGGRSVSRGVSFCSAHGEPLYLAIVEDINATKKAAA